MTNVIKDYVRTLPVIGPVARKIYFSLFPKTLDSSQKYWEERYAAGGSSGSGSYNRLAEFKAKVLNDFVRRNDVRSVIEFGCGDGSQLGLAEYPSYVGVDVSPTAVTHCQKKFQNDPTKRFRLLGDVTADPFDLALSLDVVYHLVEDETFEAHMRILFDASCRYVIIYSSNSSAPTLQPHVRHRKFSEWIAAHRSGWRLNQRIDNPYPYSQLDPGNTSFADFYIYERS